MLLVERTHLDRQPALDLSAFERQRPRQPAGPCQRAIEIRRFHDHEAPDVFLALCVGTVGHQEIAGARPDLAD